MKWLILIILISAILFLPYDSFSSADLYSDIPKGSEETAFLTPLFEKPFTYLGEGSQMIAFVSQDGQTVLKVFKARHNKPYTFSRYLKELGKRNEAISKKKWQHKFQDTCRRYRMAYCDLKEETGLVHLHFVKTATSLPITLIYKRKIQIDLANYPFIVQQKAILAPTYIRSHPEGVQALKNFFTSRTKKGYSDPRQTLTTNYGFIDGHPVQIDPGKLEPFTGDENDEIQLIHSRIDKWALSL